MTKLLALSIAAMAISVAGSALALNPQPLPPRCLPGAHCGPVLGRPYVQRRRCVIGHRHVICSKRNPIPGLPYNGRKLSGLRQDVLGDATFDSANISVKPIR